MLYSARVSTHALRWMAFALASTVWASGCVVPTQDCGGPTSDWPFCRDDAPDLAPALGEGQADGPSELPDEEASSGVDAGVEVQAPTAPASDAAIDPSDGLGFVGSGSDAGACSSCGADGGVDPGSPDDAGADGCGEPLACELEVELDAASVKSISGNPALDFTHASARWDGSTLVVHFRARDRDGREVRAEVFFDEGQVFALFGGLGVVDVQADVAGCDGADPGVLDVRTRVASLSASGIRATFDVSGDGWSTQLLLEGEVCSD